MRSLSYKTVAFKSSYDNPYVKTSRQLEVELQSSCDVLNLSVPSEVNKYKLLLRNFEISSRFQMTDNNTFLAA